MLLCERKNVLLNHRSCFFPFISFVRSSHVPCLFAVPLSRSQSSVSILQLIAVNTFPVFTLRHPSFFSRSVTFYLCPLCSILHSLVCLYYTSFFCRSISFTFAWRGNIRINIKVSLPLCLSLSLSLVLSLFVSFFIRLRFSADEEAP